MNTASRIFVLLLSIFCMYPCSAKENEYPLSSPDKKISVQLASTQRPVNGKIPGTYLSAQALEEFLQNDPLQHHLSSAYN